MNKENKWIKKRLYNLGYHLDTFEYTNENYPDIVIVLVNMKKNTNKYVIYLKGKFMKNAISLRIAKNIVEGMKWER